MAHPSPKNQSACAGDRSASPSGQRFSFLRAVAAKNKIAALFCVLAFVAMATTIKLIADLTGPEGETLIAAASQPLAVQNPGPEQAGDTGWSPRTRVSLLLGVILLSFGAMLYLFVNRVVLPLNRLSRAAEEMTKGNLSITAPSNHADELGELGHSLNSLAVNFQEVLLLMGTTVGNSCAAIERIQQALDGNEIIDQKAIKEQVSALRKDWEMLETLMKDFQFFQARFDGRKVVSQGPGKEA
jgi:HAMP domain-containing protein